MCGLKGKEYAIENYVDKWKEEVEDNKKNFYLRHPEYLDRLPDAYANDIRARTRAVNWYGGTALMIYRASEILGETAVDQFWAELYRKSEEQEQPYITKKDFLEACGLSGEEIGYE